MQSVGQAKKNNCEPLFYVGPTKAALEDTVLTRENKEKKISSSFFNALYDACMSSGKTFLVNGEIIITGHIYGDGVGDYLHMLSAAKLITKHFPDQKVMIVTSSFFAEATKDKDKEKDAFLRSLADRDIEVKFFSSSNFSLDNAFPRKILERFRHAAYVLSMSTSIDTNQFKALIEERPFYLKYRCFKEYGHTDDRDQSKSKVAKLVKCIYPQIDLPRHLIQAMGLSKDDFGLLVPELSHQALSLATLKDPVLKQALFGTANPSEEDIRNYLHTHTLNYTYMHITHWNIGFSTRQFDPTKVLICLLALAGEKKGKSIDIYANARSLEAMGFSGDDLEYLASHDIGTVEFLTKKDGKLEKQTQKLGSGSRELRFVNCFPLEQGDLDVLNHFDQTVDKVLPTESLFGCGGDNSIATAIFLGKIPFFQTVSNHKVKLLNDLTDIVKSCCGPDSPYREYLDLINLSTYGDLRASEDVKIQRNFEIAEKLISIISHPNFLKHVQITAQKIREDHVAQKKIMKRVIQDMIFLYKQDLLNDLYQQYQSKKITLSEAQEMFLRRISAT